MQIPFTKEAYEKIKSEIGRLNIEREATLERLKIAREQGDLSENGAYRYAKQELGNIGRQLRQLHYLDRFGFIAPHNTDLTHIGFGNTVTLSFEGKPIIYMIVSEYEADPKVGKISTESPIGKALFGKSIGDVVSIKVPAGERNYIVKKIN